MMKIGMLSLVFATILAPLAAAHTGAGVTVDQRSLVCNLGRDVDTREIRWLRSDVRVTAEQDCSSARVEYTSSNVRAICASIDFLDYVPPWLNLPVTQLETMPDNPNQIQPQPAPHGCWLEGHARLP